MSSENWISLFGGVVASIMGVLLIRYRVAVAKFNADTQRTVKGKPGELIARRGATPLLRCRWPTAILVHHFEGFAQTTRSLR